MLFAVIGAALVGLTFIQTEDDISASVVVPGRQLEHLPPGPDDISYKFIRNCEYRLFQRY